MVGLKASLAIVATDSIIHSCTVRPGTALITTPASEFTFAIDFRFGFAFQIGIHEPSP
jgi:hypothetical protein